VILYIYHVDLYILHQHRIIFILENFDVSNLDLVLIFQFVTIFSGELFFILQYPSVILQYPCSLYELIYQLKLRYNTLYRCIKF